MRKLIWISVRLMFGMKANKKYLNLFFKKKKTQRFTPCYFSPFEAISVAWCNELTFFILSNWVIDNFASLPFIPLLIIIWKSITEIWCTDFNIKSTLIFVSSADYLIKLNETGRNWQKLKWCAKPYLDLAMRVLRYNSQYSGFPLNWADILD